MCIVFTKLFYIRRIDRQWFRQLHFFQSQNISFCKAAGKGYTCLIHFKNSLEFSFFGYSKNYQPSTSNSFVTSSNSSYHCDVIFIVTHYQNATKIIIASIYKQTQWVSFRAVWQKITRLG